MPRYLVTLERSNSASQSFVTLFVTAASDLEARSLATAQAERQRGGRFQTLTVVQASPRAKAELLV